MSIANFVKQHTPWPIRRLSRRIKRSIRQWQDAKLTTKDVFTRIYQENRWGGTPGEIYSGPGSGEEAARPYADAVNAFIASAHVRSVLDLGCGDFRVGRAIAASGIRYMGVDIVESVVARNQNLYGSPHVQFFVKNIIEDELPDADLCLVREVFQHLSNAQIRSVLPKLDKYKYVIVTDHQPSATDFIPNLDKPHGQFIRVYNSTAEESEVRP